MNTRTVLALLAAGSTLLTGLVPASAATHPHKRHARASAHRRTASRTAPRSARSGSLTTTVSPASPPVSETPATGSDVKIDPQHPLPAPQPNPNAPAGTSGTTNQDQTGASNGTGSKNSGTAGQNGGSTAPASGATSPP